MTWTHLSLGYIFPSVLDLWQVSKGAPYPVKAPSQSVYAKNVSWPSSCSTLMAGAHVLCCWLILLSGKMSSQDVRGFGLNLVAGRLLAWYSFPVGHEIFQVRREKFEAHNNPFQTGYFRVEGTTGGHAHALKAGLCSSYWAAPNCRRWLGLHRAEKVKQKLEPGGWCPHLRSSTWWYMVRMHCPLCILTQAYQVEDP